MFKNVFKFAGGAVVIAALGIGALFAIDYLRYQKSPEYRAEMQAERIKKEYAEDPYGGDTPEETLGLFVDALKKGDIDLAAKYFVLDKQDQWREDLALAKDKSLIDVMIDEAQRLQLSKKDEKEAFYTLTNEKNVVEVQVVLIKAQNKKWKIQDL